MLALIAGGCASTGPPAPGRLIATAPSATLAPPSFDHFVVTPDGTDRYRFEPAGDGVRVSAPVSNSGGNLRSVFWREQTPVSADGGVCARWDIENGRIAQEGLMLRYRSSPGATRVITVTKNIYARWVWVINVHLWDSRWPEGSRLISRLNLNRLLTVDAQDRLELPVNVCARAVGSTVQFKFWKTGAEPSWDTPDVGETVQLPSGWEQPGRFGGYVGHLTPGDSVTYGKLRTWTGAEPGT